VRKAKTWPKHDGPEGERSFVAIGVGVWQHFGLFSPALRRLFNSCNLQASSLIEFVFFIYSD